MKKKQYLIIFQAVKLTELIEKVRPSSLKLLLQIRIEKKGKNYHSKDTIRGLPAICMHLCTGPYSAALSHL